MPRRASSNRVGAAGPEGLPSTMLWWSNGGVARDLAGIVLDKGDDHAVEVEEEHDQVERELGEGFLGSQGCQHICTAVGRLSPQR